ncbi:circularly permuted type 2 ATP-grasp protein [Cerasicoccus frondis]|uniref:circularly permuted type 2 ATP-grasp protein n=1 Tax=Cerasicoccus frondis TaxID=490090 RepID=UPI002852C888|nr:circularly permuted type 2 ATP-grasp protein [Cerasicoccus frondis]
MNNPPPMQQNQPIGQTQVQTQMHPRPSWLAAYQPQHGFYDEWKSSRGATAEHWNILFRQLADHGEADYRQREDQLERIIDENGVTYNVYSDPENPNRQWKMDAIPLLLGHDEYERIAAAENQRMRLLNMLLKDIYGEQQLLRENIYPAGLVFGNPAFLRPVHGLLPEARQFLFTHSSDLARSPDGNWWVLSDRLDAPSGLGYSVENRVISNRVMPDLMRPHEVRRVTSYLQTVSDALKNASPRALENPFVVLLTPGPYNETYFEQSYLARALGFPLVEGADLTVRDDTVFLKTIHGMRRVDVIFRRLDSEWCDPLEFRDDSLLGVPGLLNAVRQDKVVVVNAPGVGVLETPALAAFLPVICQKLLGEDLLMPSVATWWCGQKQERNYVLDNLDHLIIKPTFPTLGKVRVYYGPTLSKQQRQELVAAIRDFPERFTAQEAVLQATTPVYDEDHLTPRHFMLRTFQVFDHDDKAVMMPGGLCRVANSAVSPDVSMQLGGVSKDVWVVGGEDAVSEETTAYNYLANQSLSATAQVALSSRMADSLFWAGRYLDRSEGLIRGLLVIINAASESRNDQDLQMVLKFIRGYAPNLPMRAPKAATDLNEHIDEALRRIIQGENYPDRLTNVLEQLNRVMFSIKEMMSGDLTRMMRDMPVSLIPQEGAGSILSNTQLYDILKRLLDYMAAFAGIIAENTVRGLDWAFLNLGRRIERSIMLCELLKGSLCQVSKNEDFLMLRLLEFADSAITYRRRYLSRMQVDAIAHLLISDPSNPRSLAFQVTDILENTRMLPHYNASDMKHIDRLALRVYSDVVLVEPERLVASSDAGERPDLEALLDGTLSNLTELSNELSTYYFSVTSR